MAEECRHAEIELARGLARKDPGSVAAFFGAYHAAVYRYMLSLTNCVDEAEDLAQESLLQAAGHIRGFRAESSLKTWVHRVAYHTFTHWDRRRNRRGYLATEPVADEPAYQQIEAAQDFLLEALAQLESSLTQPIVLQEIGGFSLAEIAGILDIPEGTVKSRLFTARRRLRQILE